MHTHQPLSLRSAYRCPIHNRAVGGATDSQHVYGAAADIPAGVIGPAEAYALGAVGIGIQDGSVVHVDVRDGGRASWTYPARH